MIYIFSSKCRFNEYVFSQFGYFYHDGSSTGGRNFPTYEVFSHFYFNVAVCLQFKIFFFSSNCRTLNSKKTSGTMGRHASTTSMKQKNKDLNPKRMHEEVPIKDINIFLNLFHFLSTSIFILHFLLFFVSLTGSNGQKSQSIPKPKTCNCQRRRTDATFSKNR